MKKAIIYLIHLIYWAFYLAMVSFVVILMMKFQNEFSAAFYVKLTFISPFTILVFASAIAGFYINYSFLFVKYYLNQSFFKLAVFSLLYSVLASVTCALLIYSIFGHKALFNEGIKSGLGITLTMFAINMFHSAIGLVIRGFITGYSDIKIKEELNRRNFNTELALIKSQINPHFLFNTISNIDVLIQKDQLLASEYLNKFSEILRFSLYESDAPAIPLSKELEYIEKYIELQKIRTSNPDYVKYLRKGDPEGKMVAPMLFIPFIENAFKHSEKTKSAARICIEFVITRGEVLFECGNTHGGSGPGSQSGGKGHDIQRRRIELLYPQKHLLEISEHPFTYTVKLKIDLT